MGREVGLFKAGSALEVGKTTKLGLGQPSKRPPRNVILLDDVHRDPGRLTNPPNLNARDHA